MTYKEQDIVYENKHAFVLREKDCYTVMRLKPYYSISDSSYSKDHNGLQIAIARAKYLAQRAEQ